MSERDSRNVDSIKRRLKAKALQLGFAQCGVTSAEPLEPVHEARFAEWLDMGMHDRMEYLARDFERRGRPRESLSGAQSLIMVAAAYQAEPFEEREPDAPAGFGRVARYARGEDYHLVMDEPLKALEEWLRNEGGKDVETRRYCDAGPLMERQFAERAGLGFIGRHTLLITPEHGSWVLLGAILTTLALQPDNPGMGTCGTCTRCLNACPTGAFTHPGVLDARRCVSNLTIERRGEFRDQERRWLGDWVFGCDVCQEVCPYNKAGAGASFTELVPLRYPDGAFRLADLADLKSNRQFERAFDHSPILRPRRKGMMRNAEAVKTNQSESASITPNQKNT